MRDSQIASRTLPLATCKTRRFRSPIPGYPRKILIILIIIRKLYLLWKGKSKRDHKHITTTTITVVLLHCCCR